MIMIMMVIMMHATQWMAQPNGPPPPPPKNLHHRNAHDDVGFADSLDHFSLTSYHFYIMGVLIRQMGIFLLGC
jgi:hypothetical protein